MTPRKRLLLVFLVALGVGALAPILGIGRLVEMFPPELPGVLMMALGLMWLVGLALSETARADRKAKRVRQCIMAVAIVLVGVRGSLHPDSWVRHTVEALAWSGMALFIVLWIADAWRSDRATAEQRGR